jgi:hypothetical protein
MNYGWGVLPLGVIAGETFRDHAPHVLAAASVYGPAAIGGTVREEAPVFLFQARAPGPNTYKIVFDSLPGILFNASLPGPQTYKAVYDHAPVVVVTAFSTAPADSVISLIAPRSVFYEYEFDGTSLSIPIADLIGLSVAEADAVTGDWRDIFKALLLSSTEYHYRFQWSIQPKTYEPFFKDLYHSDASTSYSQIKFVVNMGEPNVAPEP